MNFCFGLFTQEDYTQVIINNNLYDNLQTNIIKKHELDSLNYSFITNYLSDNEVIEDFDNYDFGFKNYITSPTIMSSDFLFIATIIKNKNKYLSNNQYIEAYFKDPYFIYDFALQSYDKTLKNNDEVTRDFAISSAIKKPLKISSLKDDTNLLLETYESLAAMGLQGMLVANLYNKNVSNPRLIEEQLYADGFGLDKKLISTSKMLAKATANYKLSSFDYKENLASKREVKILRQKVIALAYVLYHFQKKVDEEEKNSLILASLIKQNQDTINTIKEVLTPV
jgi:hypothetical protein